MTVTAALARENCALSVPSSLYLSSVPLTSAAHLNPRRPESTPCLSVTTSPALGVIPPDLGVFLVSSATESMRETLISLKGTAVAVTTIGTEDPPREQVIEPATTTLAYKALTLTLRVGRPVYLAVPLLSCQ